MAIWTVLKNIKAKQLFSFFRFFIRHPLFAIATFFATLETYKIAEKEFPKIHGKLNKANAFRHALWNLLIAKYCYRFSKNISHVLQWTEDVTLWHEDLFINEPLTREMDIHNNRIGREMFQYLFDSNVVSIKTKLLELLDSAIRVTSLNEIAKIDNELVYLEQ